MCGCTDCRLNRRSKVYDYFFTRVQSFGKYVVKKGWYRL